MEITAIIFMTIFLILLLSGIIFFLFKALSSKKNVQELNLNKFDDNNQR